MTADVVIQAEGLGKRYRIGHQAQPGGYVALRDVLATSARRFGRSVRDLASGRAMVGGDQVEDFWALKDIDFAIERGEVVGVIGRNGAGKSTLLKVLSRITEPTEGRVTIKGRLASLLEVGTGFHPELTGRENIFLNGAILGMRRAEIRRKFHEIVDFAEVERFLDTPVKRYSSGMYVRLAFAIAAHLEPEILVVDEVLAVGDTEFQRKSLGKMESVAGEGRSVIFVSHNMPTIARLCNSAIVLSQGRAAPKESISAGIARYQNQVGTALAGGLGDWKDRIGNGDARIVRYEIQGSELESGAAALGSTVEFVFDVEFLTPVDNPTFGVLVHDALGDIIFDLRSSNHMQPLGTCKGSHRVRAALPNLGLLPGQYLISLWVNNDRESEDLDFVRTCGSFQVVDPHAENRRARLDSAGAKFWTASGWAVERV